MIGFAALGVLPARAGDVLRPYLLARQEGLSTSATFATIVMERVLDLIAVLSLLVFYVWGVSDRVTPAAGPAAAHRDLVGARRRRGGRAHGDDVAARHAS